MAAAPKLKRRWNPHLWGKESVPRQAILPVPDSGVLRPPGQVVCDPRQFGRASVALAARKLGCPFIGADSEEASIARVRRTLEEEEG